MKLNNKESILIKKLLTNDISDKNSLLKKLVSYIYDYFWEFEKKRLNKKKLFGILLKKIKNKNNFYFLILKEKRIIGFVHIYKTKKFLDLCLIYIEKGFRRKGIGRKVISYLKDYFKKKLINKKIKYFRIEINSKNYSSQKFFKKLGAEEESRIYFLKI